MISKTYTAEYAEERSVKSETYGFNAFHHFLFNKIICTIYLLCEPLRPLRFNCRL